MVYTLEAIKAIVSPIAAKYGIRAIYVFGSYATGTAHSKSDIDFLVDTTGTALNSLFSLGELYCELEVALGKKIDLLTLSALEQGCQMQSDLAFRQRVEAERMEIYAVA